MRTLFVILLSLFTLCIWAKDQPLPKANGVILLYHHVSDTTPASTSISPKNFALHMDYLAKHHTVIPLSQMVSHIQNGLPLPEKAVAITFDDGYRDIIENGHPILKEHGFSYTIFISPDLIGRLPQQITWEQITRLQNEGVTFANHTSRHQHLLTGYENAPQKWLLQTLKNIDKAENKLRQRTGKDLKLLAYPYGEYNQVLQQAILERGYVGFSQQSGAVAPYSDFSALPRIPAAGIYANLDTLKVKLSSLAMPVISKTINNPQLPHQQRLPEQRLKLNTDDFDIALFSCYFQHKPVDLKWHENEVTILLDNPLPIGRSRVNCTAPSIQYQGRYYWYSQPWFVPTADDNWPD